MRLENKVALITGGYGGMGRASARLFAKEGAAVVITGRNEERGSELAKELAGDGAKAHFAELDITDQDQWTGVLAGPLDLLIGPAEPALRVRVGGTGRQHAQILAGRALQRQAPIRHEMQAVLALPGGHDAGAGAREPRAEHHVRKAYSPAGGDPGQSVRCSAPPAPLPRRGCAASAGSGNPPPTPGSASRPSSANT